MPRCRGATPGSFCDHGLNRGKRRSEIVHAAADYEAFVGLVAEAAARFPVRLPTFWPLPNHFHYAVWPPGDADLSADMYWLITTHASCYQKCYHRTGHVWQGRLGCAGNDQPELLGRN